MISIGGFPQYVANPEFMTLNERGLSIRSDTRSILGGTVLPGEKLDSTTEDAILKSLLVNPGGILNVSSIGRELGFDNRTVER